MSLITASSRVVIVVVSLASRASSRSLARTVDRHRHERRFRRRPRRVRHRPTPLISPRNRYRRCLRPTSRKTTIKTSRQSSSSQSAILVSPFRARASPNHPSIQTQNPRVIVAITIETPIIPCSRRSITHPYDNPLPSSPFHPPPAPLAESRSPLRPREPPPTRPPPPPLSLDRRDARVSGVDVPELPRDPLFCALPIASRRKTRARARLVLTGNSFNRCAFEYQTLTVHEPSFVGRGKLKQRAIQSSARQDEPRVDRTIGTARHSGLRATGTVGA